MEFTGRPITKTNPWAQYLDEDEGYGHSPIPDLGCFLDHEWELLAREIDQFRCSESSSVMNTNIRHKDSKPVKLAKWDNRSSRSTLYCPFCAKNGESRTLVESHRLRHPVTGAVLCPVLRNYRCELCGATGDSAHTRCYCPLNPNNTASPAAIALKKTKFNSTGRRHRS